MKSNNEEQYIGWGETTHTFINVNDGKLHESLHYIKMSWKMCVRERKRERDPLGVKQYHSIAEAKANHHLLIDNKRNSEDQWSCKRSPDILAY